MGEKEINAIELKYLTEKTEKLYNHPLSILYLEPVDPEKDHAPDYFDIISKPMDLGTVKKKLEEGKYKSTKDWFNDVNLVFQNSKRYVNDSKTLIWNAADILQKKALDYYMHTPKSESDLWTLEVQKISKKIDNLLSAAPKYSIVHQDQINQLSSN